MNSHDTTLTTKQERGIILTKGSVFMKKLKKWQKIVIGVLMALIVVIGGLKIFKRPILSAVLSKDELVIFDTYVKAKRVSKLQGANLSLKKVALQKDSGDGTKNTVVVFGNEKEDLICQYTYNEDFDILFTLTSLNSPTKYNGGEDCIEYEVEQIDKPSDLFHISYPYDSDKYAVFTHTLNVIEPKNSSLASKVKFLDFLF
jgi:hypothetical protein